MILLLTTLPKFTMDQVKIFYTAILKENGHIFDSNVGKSPCKFRLGINFI